MATESGYLQIESDELSVSRTLSARRQYGARLQSCTIAACALLFPLALWALPPNNRTACDFASQLAEVAGNNRAALYFARRARDEPGSNGYSCMNAVLEDEAERDADIRRLERKLAD